MLFHEHSGTHGHDIQESRPLWSSVNEDTEKDASNRNNVQRHHDSDTNVSKWLKIWVCIVPHAVSFLLIPEMIVFSMQAAAACVTRLVIPSCIVLVLYIVTDMYKLDSNILYGIYILWGLSGFLTLSGIVSLLSGHMVMLAAHICMACILTPVAIATYTCWFFLVHQICQDHPSYAGCSAWQKENYAHYLLSLVGVVLCIPSCVEAYLCTVLVYTHHVCPYVKRISREKSLQHMVAQQTRLLAAADTPAVTPETLRSWVSELLMSEDSSCRQSGELCKMVLRRRGYKLKVMTHPSDLWSPHTHAMGLVNGKDAVIV